MYRFLVILILVILLSSCNKTNGEEFTISGKVTAIDAKNHYVYVDNQGPIKYKDYNELEIGQRVTFVLYSKSKDDLWDPKLIKIKSFKSP
ncbi:hypothetical protein [Cohnella lupini]|uniref:DUF3221 domain-containing protein n=1 Tax=Cohnella lupini TaxID=1294267 RepID=A0A3D9HQA3_9BACL|nr:hypothetical protein [Cohnella lupini]RED51629.1 hypothetical protein DFP95_1424 [Cohnella lupini]